MFGSLKRTLRRISSKSKSEIYPDEVFLDSRNLPDFDKYQMEGRLERPISRYSYIFTTILIVITLFVFTTKLYSLQIVDGDMFRERSINNSLKKSLLIAPRGTVYSRNGEKLIYNFSTSTDLLFPQRKYIDEEGFGLLLGFVKNPALDANGYFINAAYDPKDGVELYMNDAIAGYNGSKLSEVSVNGDIISENVVEKPIPGQDLFLSIDSRIQNEMFKQIRNLAEKVDFKGGTGAIMDIYSGELIAMTSYPEYNPQVMTDGTDVGVINSYLSNPDNPFLERINNGLYTPGSIVKPFLAFAALEEGVITPEREIVSTGRLVIPNPYNPDNPTIFKDWKAHGATDMRRAIAVSSDVYFYQIGGGFGSQKGLGVANIKKYLEKFGFARDTGFGFGSEAIGVIPDPEWKAKTFDGEEWRIGDTYNTSIGQYGTQITPIQAVRAVAALANGGHLVTPSLVFTSTSTVLQSNEKIEGDSEHFQIAREGMRMAVTDSTAIGLNTKDVAIAAKTGTAELGAKKQFVNSWVVGFFPYENPKYAFALVMEKGPVKNLVGATSVMRQVIDFMARNTREYLVNDANNS